MVKNYIIYVFYINMLIVFIIYRAAQDRMVQCRAMSLQFFLAGNKSKLIHDPF
jgi:hypothetical protein